jgi:glycosyltransferase involved in cell wall biosynthesis
MLSNSPNNQQELFDVVVFLHPGNWFDELTSNRWHYIRFFDQFVDVIIVQPTRDKTIRGRLERDGRFTRTRIFHTGTIRPVIDSPNKGARTLLSQLDALGYKHPLYWLSTPLFWNVACHLDDSPIIFHATEDYPRLSAYNQHPASSFIRKSAIKAAENALVTLSVSDGVTKSLEEIVEIRNLVQSTNGYASADYGPESPVKSVDFLNSVNSITYCGNINKRIDFPLLVQVAVHCPERSLVLVGPVHLDETNEQTWQELLSLPNVKHLTQCTIPEMNWLYRNSSTGIIPYLLDPVIVESGFPLKTLEMAATGLPVVTTQMKSLEGISPLICVTKDHSNFLQSLKMNTRLDGQPGELESLSAIEKFRYEVQIPRVWEMILSYSALAIDDGHKRQLVRFSFFSAAIDTVKLLRSRGFLPVVKAFKRALLPSS